MTIFEKIILVLVKLAVVFLTGAVIGMLWLNWPVKNQNDSAKLGITFSHRYAQDIGLDWKEAYLAILDDLEVKKIRIPVYWDLVEKEQGVYNFSDVDWQLDQAEIRGVDVILVLGQKVPRWPECFIPSWAEEGEEARKRSLLEFMAFTVQRYRDREEIKYWQVENEPFLAFGICPPFDKRFLDREIDLVRSLDPTREIIVTASGEISIWSRSAKRGDVLGTTLYRTVWKEGYGFFNYPVGPRFFHLKYWISRVVTGTEKAFVIELQAEPWIAGWTTHGTLEEQFRSMNEEKLEENVIFARKVGFSEIYLWGAEWWYWLKTEKKQPQLWEKAGGLFME